MDDVLLRESSYLTERKNLLIVGDFNVPQIDWENLIAPGPDQGYSSKFIDMSIHSLLVQHMHEPTRFVDGQRPIYSHIHPNGRRHY